MVRGAAGRRSGRCGRWHRRAARASAAVAAAGGGELGRRSRSGAATVEDFAGAGGAAWRRGRGTDGAVAGGLGGPIQAQPGRRRREVAGRMGGGHVAAAGEDPGVSVGVDFFPAGAVRVDLGLGREGIRKFREGDYL